MTTGAWILISTSVIGTVAFVVVCEWLERR